MSGTMARGLSDIQVYNLVALDAFDTDPADVAGARTLGYSTSSDTEPWEGDDTILAQAANAPTGSGTITAAKVSLPALATIKGGTVGSTGVTPNIITTYNQPGTASTNYFGIAGQSNAADGGAYRVTIHKAIASEVSEELGINAWNEPSITFEFLPNVADEFISRAQYETAVPIEA